MEHLHPPAFQTLKEIPIEERPRERLAAVGEKALSTSEVLAILLRTGSGGEHVLRLAERLLFTFGGLDGIARATLTELQSVKGIGRVKAIELKATCELGRRLMTHRPEQRTRIIAPSDAANLLMPDMALLEQEHLNVVILDSKNRVLRVITLYIGSLNSATVRVAEIYRAAIRENGAAIVVAHNHPSGDPTPSKEDVNVTREMVKAGKLLGVQLLDHLIIGRGRFVSLKERGLGFENQ